MTGIILGSPLRGWAMRLEEVPDPVFAERMMGDGIAIDPLEGLVVAPAAGKVASAPATGHAITLALANGAHILIHVGIDTVRLGGEGFERCVAEGDAVEPGAPLIRFDMDKVARRAKSLVTPIVLIDSGFSMKMRAADRLVAIGEPLLEIEGVAAASIVADGGPRVERRVTLRLHNGLHARPAARIVDRLKSHQAQMEIASEARRADARSLVALLALGLKHGQDALLSAAGPDAEQAIAAVAALLQDETAEAASAPAPVGRPQEPARIGAIGGISAASGLAVGPIFQFRPMAIDIPEKGKGIAAETRRLDEAIAALSAALCIAGDQGTGIALAHLAIVEDPELLAAAKAEIQRDHSAAFGWASAIAAASEAIRATGDALLIERIADLQDVERQLLDQLAGPEAMSLPDVPTGAILVADDLLPSQFLGLRGEAAGIATARGGATSHVAILAAAAGMPMLVGLGPKVLALPDEGQAILDAEHGTLDPMPDASALAAVAERLARRDSRRAAEAVEAMDACRMADGTRIHIYANLASEAEAQRAVAAGAEGCGLLRTEFLFLDRALAPSEEEQANAYRAIATALGERPLIVRTLDIGADKQVPYLPLPREDNPALGQRGIRLGLANPDLLRTQLRAILRGVPAAQCRIMLPMVVERDELRKVRRMIAEVQAGLGRDDRVQLGAMIETPAAALLADSLAEEADFLSIGTNDLTQYALASDRLNPATAGLADALHPAVLHLIRLAAEGARRHDRWLGVCGGLASDPVAAPILIGLGAGELSAAPAIIPALKAAVRRLRRDDCEALARRALGCASAVEVRRLLAPVPDALKGAA